MSFPPLFAYGTLLDPAMRLSVLGHECSLQPAILPGYAVRQGKYPYLAPEAGRTVNGLLLLELNEGDYARLDDYEDLPLGYYTREIMSVTGEDGSRIACHVYMPCLARWPKDWLA